MSEIDHELRRAAHRRGHSMPMRRRAAADRAFDSVTAQAIYDVSDFTGGLPLSDSNIDDAIDAAYEAARADSVDGLLVGTAPLVYVPAGTYRLSRPHVFPGLGYHVVPGFRGAGRNQTVFVVDTDADGSYAFQFGSATHTGSGNSFCVRPDVGGFSIAALTESSCNRSGVIFYAALYPVVSDLRVRGLFHPSMTFEQGRGIKFGRHLENGNPLNSQYISVSTCLVESCMVGFDFDTVYPGTLSNCDAHGNRFANAIFESAQLEWYGADIQLQGAPYDATLWWGGGADRASVISGFTSTAGLDSGAAASVSTASSGLVTVTGLTGLDVALDRGRWLQLTPAGLTANDLKVRGLYKIASVTNATTCVIYKGSDHTAATNVAWQVRQSAGSNEITMQGLYDEAVERVSTWGFYREAGDSEYVLRDCNAHGMDYAIDADGCNAVIAENQSLRNATIIARLRSVKRSQIDAPISSIEVDDYSYPGLVCRYDAPALQGRSLFGWRDANGGRAKSVRRLATELGAIEIWDPRVTSSLTLDGSDADAITGLINGTVASPVSATSPTYVAADSGLGPCIANVAGVNTAGGRMAATIAGANVPDHPFLCTLFLVARLENTTPTAGEVRRFQVSSAGGTVQCIAFNDAVWIPTGNYVLTENPGNSVTVIPASDTLAHVYSFGRHPNDGNVISTDNGENYRQNNAATTAAMTHVAGGDLSVLFGCNTIAAGTTNLFRWGFAAIFPRTLSEAETQQLIDLARKEWPALRQY